MAAGVRCSLWHSQTSVDQISIDSMCPGVRRTAYVVTDRDGEQGEGPRERNGSEGRQ
jgi:hypothetical protein